MTGRPPDFVDRIVDQLTGRLGREVRLEVRQEFIENRLLFRPQEGLPDPMDIDLERLVIGGVLCNEVSLAELSDLEPKHYYLRLHRWIWEQLMHCSAAGITPSVDLVCGVAGEAGISPDFLRPELEYLTTLPWVSPSDARDAAVRLIELADARDLTDRLARAVICLKSGTLSAAQVRARLRQLVSQS